MKKKNTDKEEVEEIFENAQKKVGKKSLFNSVENDYDAYHLATDQ